MNTARGRETVISEKMYDDLGKERGWPATRREGKINRWNSDRFNEHQGGFQRCRRSNDHNTGRCVHLPASEHCDSALVRRLACIRVKCLVQRLRVGHCQHKQKLGEEQNGHDPPVRAGAAQPVLCLILQDIFSSAETMQSDNRHFMQATCISISCHNKANSGCLHQRLWDSQSQPFATKSATNEKRARPKVPSDGRDVDACTVGVRRRGSDLAEPSPLDSP